jgi:hypothetical protein
VPGLAKASEYFFKLGAKEVISEYGTATLCNCALQVSTKPHACGLWIDVHLASTIVEDSLVIVCQFIFFHKILQL